MSVSIDDIADHIVESGSANKKSGNYIFDFVELANDFGLTEEIIDDLSDDILRKLVIRTEVADAEIYHASFDVNFYTKYCKNMEV